jgi:hypothetical protein
MVSQLNVRTTAREAQYEMVQYISARLTMSGTADLPVVKIGTLPAGSIPLWIASRVATAVTGGTPVLGVSFATAGAAAPAVGTTSNVQNVLAEAAGSEMVFPLAAMVLPLTVDTDFYVGTSGGVTAGDVYITIGFVKPLA